MRALLQDYDLRTPATLDEALALLAETSDEVIITQNGKPLARLETVSPPKKRSALQA